MDVLLLADLDNDTARLYSAAPDIARHSGRYVLGEEVAQERLRGLACVALREAINGRSIQGQGGKYGN